MIRVDIGGRGMSETAQVRDWLGELEALVATDEVETFQAHALVAVKARPDLRGLPDCWRVSGQC